MRKAIAAISVLCLAAATAAAQTHVKFTLSAFNASPTTNRVTTIQARTPFLGNLISYTSDTNGVFYVSNMLAGDYSGVITKKGNASEIPFQITVTATNLGLVTAEAITSQLGVQTYPTTGRSSWTIQAADARYNAVGSAATNVINIAAGSRVTITTNSATLNTVNADPQTNATLAALAITGVGTAAYSNSTAFDLAGTATAATNGLNTALRTYTDNATNSLSGVLTQKISDATNATGGIKAGAFALGVNSINSWDDVTNYFAQTGSGPSGALTNNDTRAVNFISSVTANQFIGDGSLLTGIPGSGDVFAVNNLTDLNSLSAARTNLGSHSAANLTIGTLPDLRLSSAVTLDTELAHATNNLNASAIVSGTVPEANSAHTITNLITSAQTATNLTQRVVNPADGTGLVGSRLGSGYLWQSSGGGSVFGYSGNSFNIYTNLAFSESAVGIGTGLTNAYGVLVFPTNAGLAGQIISLTADLEHTAFIAAAGAGDLQSVNNLADVASTTQSRTNLGAHNADNISRGTVADARLSGNVVTNYETQAITLTNAGNIVAVANLTNAALTASRLVLSGGQKQLISAAASGAVSVNADGSATTFAQINALGPSISGMFITNNGNGYTNAGNISASTFNGGALLSTAANNVFTGSNTFNSLFATQALFTAQNTTTANVTNLNLVGKPDGFAFVTGTVLTTTNNLAAATNLNASELRIGTVPEARSAHTLTNVGIRGIAYIGNVTAGADWQFENQSSILNLGDSVNAMNFTFSTNGTFTALALGGNGSALTSLNATNIVDNPNVLTTAGNVTNFTLQLLPGTPYAPVEIYTLNTNVYFTFLGTNAGWSRTVLLNGFTNTVDTKISWNNYSTVRTNFNFDSVQTNGFGKIINFYCVNGINIIATDGGRWR